MSDISMTLTVDGATDVFVPVGANLTYGYNMIPYATVRLEMNDKTLQSICNFDDRYRRKVASIDIKTKFGCITFDGLADGLSYDLSPGSMSLQLVIKNKFQALTEVSAKFPGICPNGLDIFTRPALLTLQNNSQVSTEAEVLALFLQFEQAGFDGNPVDVIIHLLKKLLNTQNILTKIAPANRQIFFPTEFVKLLKETKGSIDSAKLVMDNIVTKWTQGMAIRTMPAVADLIMRGIVNSSGSLFDTLVSLLSQFNCAIVIGNDQAYIVPDVGFLEVPKPSGKSVGIGAKSHKVNILFPAQYSSINFNDTGYKDIKACYVYADANSNTEIVDYTAGSIVGSYIDYEATGGIFTIQLPHFITLGADRFIYNVTRDLQKKIKAKEPSSPKTVDDSEIVADSFKNSRGQSIDEQDALRKDFFDNWAQLQYLQLKYRDRMGSIHGMFYPHIAPCAVGAAFTRFPGMFLDFFITSVTHSFIINEPNSGSTSTDITFNCGRTSAGLRSKGVDKVAIFKDFSGKDSLDFATSFVANVTAGVQTGGAVQ